MGKRSRTSRIFLCHAREDRRKVLEIYDWLKAKGLNPWVDKKDMLPGQNWREEVRKTIKSAGFMVVFLSKTAVEKEGYVQREFRMGLDMLEEMPEGKIFVIPVRLEDCEIPERFEYLHCCDWFEDDGQEMLLRSIRYELERAGVTTEPDTDEGQERFVQPVSLKLLPDGLKSFHDDDFVRIPAGHFQMGSEDGNNDERPVHRVEISRDFYLGKHPVTQAQWEEVMGDNPSYFKGENKPVESISCEDVQKFIQQLNQKCGKTVFRLPTEAEWEYACRAGTTGDYAGKLDEMGWYGEDWSTGKTHPAGKKQPNAWGLYDMHGNVWEWCADWYGSKYYSSSPAADPQGPKTGSNRVCRGGSWSSNAGYCRSANRMNLRPGGCSYDLGVRLLRIIDNP